MSTEGFGNIGSGIGQLNSAGKPSIGQGNPPNMKTLIYSPSARIIIARGNRQYDVSGGLVNGGVLRPENAAASLQFTLNNKNLRYNGLFDRMDRVILFLKRIKSIQVFSGYLDDVPYLQLYPGTVTFRATCVIKRLMHTWWDPSTEASQQLFSSQGGDAGAQVVGDGTTVDGTKPIGSIIRDLLTEVAGWDPNQVQIENFPTKFLTIVRQWMAVNQSSTQASVDGFLQLLLGDDHSMGVGATASANPALALGASNVIGSPNYVAAMIKMADQLGMGPNVSDLQQSQQVDQISSGLSGSRDPATQAFGKNLEGAAQNWNQQYRNSDAAILALACAMQESMVRILANPAVPDSYNFYHDGEDNNGTSLGLYQQISGGQWGDVSQRMNVDASTRGFLLALAKVDWKNMDPGAAIQAVQQSKFPGNYGQWVQAATAQIQAARGATTTASSLGIPTAISNPLSPAALIGTSQGAIGLIPSLGTTQVGGSAPTSATALAGASKPSPDAMGAIAAGLTYVGSPYDQIRPPVRGLGVDCSGLIDLAYRSIGVQVGGYTGAQINAGTPVSAANVQPGDICFPNGGHVFMYLGTGYPGGGGAALILESSGSDWGHNGPSSDGPKVKPLHYNLSSMQTIRHIADFGGWDPTVKYNDPTFMGPGHAPSTFGTSNVGTGYSAGGAGGAGQEPIARNLFTYQFNYPAFAPKMGAFFTGERSLLNCDPLITMIQGLCKATLRNWCSSPTGDFVAWYPDYWGLDGKQAVMHIEDIEMKDVTINLNDYSLITHAYVATGTGGGQSMGPWGWIESGVASVENEALYQQMIKISPGLSEPLSGSDILTKFGARPFMQEYDMVQNSELRQLLAIHHFMEGWTNQFATNVQFTFMPELFPGMRLDLVGHNLQVYVTQVQHTFDYAHGFSTQATVTAPSVPNGTSQVNQAQSLAQSALQPFTGLLSTVWPG